MGEHYVEGTGNIFNHSWFIYVEQYTPADIEQACSVLWGDKGTKRYVRLLKELRNQRKIMERMATLTTSLDSWSKYPTLDRTGNQ